MSATEQEINDLKAAYATLAVQSESDKNTIQTLRDQVGKLTAQVGTLQHSQKVNQSDLASAAGKEEAYIEIIDRLIEKIKD